MESSKISIIIPMRNEEKYIEKCIHSLIYNDYSNTEIIIINSMSDDHSLDIVNKYINKYTNIRCYDNKNIYTPFAFNIGIKHAIGEYIFIVSAHCEYDKNYFSILVKYARKLNADAIGAVSKTGIINNTFKAHSIKTVLSHKLGVGNSYFRIGVNKITEVDAISGCYNTRVFKKHGLYNEKLIRNQDIELNKRIKNTGGKLYLIPYTSYTYFVRENFTDLAKNNFENGKWNILTSYYTKALNSLSLRHFIPLIFILSLLLPSILSFLNINFLLISVLSLGSYLALVIIVSLKSKNNDNRFFYLMASFLTLHISYGLGSLIGIFSVFKKIIKGIYE